MSIPANPAASGIQSSDGRIIPPTVATTAITRPAAKPAMLPGIVMPPSVPAGTRSQVVISRALYAAVLPDFAGHGVGRGFGQSRHRGDQPNPISGGAENNRGERSYRQIGQDLPGIPAFPALGEPERQLAAVSQAGGYPGHHKQGCERGESRWAGAGKKQETGKTPRQGSGAIDAAQEREPAPRSPASRRQRWPAAPGMTPSRGLEKESALVAGQLSALSCQLSVESHVRGNLVIANRELILTWNSHDVTCTPRCPIGPLPSGRSRFLSVTAQRRTNGANLCKPVYINNSWSRGGHYK